MSGICIRSVIALIVALTLWLCPVGEAPDRSAPPPGVSSSPPAAAQTSPPLPPPQAIEIPILVYHHVMPGRAAGSELARRLFVTPEILEEQLKYLRDDFYQAITFDDLADCLDYGKRLPERPVIISFDDGWENQFAYGFPLLRKYGFTATFFVVTNYLDHPNFMTTDQLKAMIAAGMTIGAHSRSHPPLPSLGNGPRLKDEIAGSKAWLEEQLGVAVDTFAYPYGSYNAAVVAATKATGYRTARTVDGGTHTTADTLETLPGIIFPQFMNRYRAALDIAPSDIRR
jgi:peptidoglycan/xylan/chitin deacetylase (PgdA/CDA1 family)